MQMRYSGGVRPLLSAVLLWLAVSPVWGNTLGRTLVPEGVPNPAEEDKKPKKKLPPDQLYLNAYRYISESEKMAAKEDYNAAIKRARQAEKVLATIVRDYPDWRSSLVAARRNILSDNIAKYREKAKSSPIPTGRQPGRPVATTGPSLELPNTPTVLPDEVTDYRPVRLPANADAADRRLVNQLALAQEEIRKMANAYRALKNRFDETNRELITARLEQQQYRERYEKLLDQVSTERAAGNRVVDSLTKQLEEMEAKYRASESARKAAEERAEDLERTLAATRAELKRVTAERDALKVENEQLRAIVELNNPDKTKMLLDQNLTLAEQLKSAQARVRDLEAQMVGTSDEREVLSSQLDAARKETERLRDEMSGVYDENRAYRIRVSELTDKLNNLEAELNARENGPKVDPALQEEVALLREVIAKQRRSLEMQEEGRKLMIETYKQIKNNDPAMLRALQKLDDESTLELTAAERNVLQAVVAGDGSNKEDEGAKAVRDSLQMEALANLADSAFSRARYTAAEQLYRTLYEVKPDHVPGLVNLGTILLYRNKCEEALEYFNRSMRLARDLALPYYLAGIAQYRLNRMQEALVLFSRTVELDPANAEAFFYLANIEGLGDDLQRALKHYAAAVKLNPALGDAHYNMSRLYAELKKIPEAARSYDLAIKNGAEPDPEYERYLRNHPDNKNAPGEDLVASILPEAEAAALRSEDSEWAAAVQQEGLPSEPDPDPDPADPASDEDASDEDAFAAHMATVVRRIEAAPTPSPAGTAAADPSRFSTVRVKARRNGRTRTIKLRLKAPAPQRLRQRGGDIIDLPKEEKK